MWSFYIIALIPTCIAIVQWCLSKKINFLEALGGTVVAFVVSGILHVVVLKSQLHDTETWSGKVIAARYEPYWESSHIVVDTYTDSKGNSHTSTRTVYEDEGDFYEAVCDFGGANEPLKITETEYNYLVSKFGLKQAKLGARPNYHKGDKYDYWAINKNNWFEPVTKQETFDNRLKNSKTLFSHIKVPEQNNLPNYPENETFGSSRLIGVSTKIDLLEFDRFNSTIGPIKKVNVIVVGFTKSCGLIDAQYLEAKWLGGKKNDLVICFGVGEDLNKAEWAYVFGWSESELVKRNLETIMLENPIGDNLLPLFKLEILKNYEIKDWSKFDYITISPPWWSYLVLIAAMLISQCGFWYWAYTNDHDGVSISHPYSKKRNKYFR